MNVTVALLGVVQLFFVGGLCLYISKVIETLHAYKRELDNFRAILTRRDELHQQYEAERKKLFKEFLRSDQ